VWAVLHRIGRSSAGALDSVRTDRTGRYTLRLPEMELEAEYFVSAEYSGIGYFSDRVRVEGGGRSAVDPLVVHDTTSVGPAIVLQRRLITIALPGRDGAREVLELLDLLNPGTKTRVARDSLRPVWTGALPREAVEFSAGESDMSPSAIQRRSDDVAVFAPLVPARLHQVSYRYYLPGSARSVTVPLDQPIGDLNLLLEDTAATVAGVALEAVATEPIENRRFAGYRTEAVPGGAAITVSFSATPFPLERLVPWIVGVVAVMLGIGLWRALRRPA
jgi:hypothetical protein